MAEANIVEIKPLYIDSFDKKSRLVGRTLVYSRMRLYKYKAKIYRCPNDIDETSELYKVVIKRRHVIGYCMVFVDDDNYLDVPLFASLDSHYRMGRILSQIAFDRMFDLNCRGMRLIASWNSLLHHYRMGLYPHSQQKINGEEYDKIIAGGDKKQIQNLGCIVMYLPEDIVAAKMAENIPVLDIQKLDILKGCVGSAGIWNKRKKKNDVFNIIKMTHSSGIEDFTLVYKYKKIASITLNYFHKFVCENGYNIYQNCLKEYPAWSIFALYGADKSRPDKTFAEYWSIKKSKEYEYAELLRVLFQIALEAGSHKGAPRLQIEADWDEHSLVYDYGFRTQSYNFPRSAEEIALLIEKEAAKLKRRKGSLNLNKLGSVAMSIEKEKAAALGHMENRVLNCCGYLHRCHDWLRRVFVFWRKK